MDESNHSSETQSDTSSEEIVVEATVKPMLEILKLEKFDSFIIDS